jgi:hypothetical protein
VTFISKWLTPRQRRVTIAQLALKARKGPIPTMTRTNLALTPAHAVEVSRRCALGGGYAWHFVQSPLNRIRMGDATTARRLRRQPT